MRIFRNDWAPLLAPELKKDYYLALRQFLIEEYKHHTIYPDQYDLYNALHLTSYADAKVVILGQDPYHGPNQAHGLSFSVKPGVPPPPSLKNIFKELHSDLGVPIPNHGFLEHWAKQGVLLLNTVLTVRQGAPASHRGKGWEILTDRIISLLNEREKPLVFVLWGSHAQAKRKLITNERHMLIMAPHPSPLSAHRGFFGSRPFSKVNAFLQQIGEGAIAWALPDPHKSSATLENIM